MKLISIMCLVLLSNANANLKVNEFGEDLDDFLPVGLTFEAESSEGPTCSLKFRTWITCANESADCEEFSFVQKVEYLGSEAEGKRQCRYSYWGNSVSRGFSKEDLRDIYINVKNCMARGINFDPIVPLPINSGNLGKTDAIAIVPAAIAVSAIALPFKSISYFSNRHSETKIAKRTFKKLYNEDYQDELMVIENEGFNYLECINRAVGYVSSDRFKYSKKRKSVKRPLYR